MRWYVCLSLSLYARSNAKDWDRYGFQQCRLVARNAYQYKITLYVVPVNITVQKFYTEWIPIVNEFNTEKLLYNNFSVQPLFKNISVLKLYTPVSGRRTCGIQGEVLAGERRLFETGFIKILLHGFYIKFYVFQLCNMNANAKSQHRTY